MSEILDPKTYEQISKILCIFSHFSHCEFY